MLPKRLTLVTLGVTDVARARAFYERLGFEAAGIEEDEVVFFQLEGSVLALFGRKDLAGDAGVPQDGEGFRGVSLAINVGSEAEVDAALHHAESCGATIVKPARKVFWGGYSGYFADFDGHLWEVAFNPLCPLDEQGRMQLPPPKKAP
jgi:catechol 2,3-dioxygenase-like lactoylglutathione lyase family enzyme